MSNVIPIELTIGPEKIVTSPLNELNIVDVLIPLQCPDCSDEKTYVGTWGKYETTMGNPTRYRCYTCGKTFNIAKIPFWKDKLSEIIWKMAQLTIDDRISVHGLAKKWGIPVASLYVLVGQIKSFLADVFEQAKIMYLRQNKEKTHVPQSFRVFYYDEGFLRLLGIQAYLIFTLDGNGMPLTVQIEEDRSAETIYTHLLSAINQSGGIDVFIADGAPAILTALRALRKQFLFIRHIHQGDRKRAELLLLEPIPNRKGILETRLQLHTGSLLPNTETLMVVNTKIVYPKHFNGNRKVPEHNNKKDKVKPKETLPTTIFLADKKGKRDNKQTKTTTRRLKGPKIVVNTGPQLGQFEVNYLYGREVQAEKKQPPLEKILSMLFLAQQVLPHQFISSNRAEVFNALHDHFNGYWGRKSIDHGNHDLKAWVVMRFFPDQAKKLIQNHEWKLHRSLLQKVWPLIISKVKW